MKSNKGFRILHDDSQCSVSSLKQHLNLTHYANMVMKEDERNFSNSEKDVRENFVGSEFLNRVFANFWMDAEATLSQRLMSEREAVTKMFSSNEFRGVDKSIISLFVDKILNVRKEELKAKARSYEKGVSFKFNINKKNLDLLRTSEESKEYEGIILLYLKPIFEEYARKPMHEREQIYFKSNIDDLNNAITHKRCVKMSLLSKITPKTHEVYTRKFYFIPHRIIQDKSGMYNYAIGYSEEIKEDGSLAPRIAACYRISRIEHITVLSSGKSGFVSKADKEALDKMIAEKDPMFLTGESLEVKARFTDKGVESLSRQLYMRPTVFEKVEGEENTYIFKCNEVQATNYFFKFARDVEILEPQRLRNKFKWRYKSGYIQYLDDEEKEQ